MESAAVFTNNIAYSALLNPKITDRANAKLAKVCTYVIQGLKKGLTEEEKIDFIKRLNSLPDKTFTFGYFVSAGHADNLHPLYVVLSSRNFFGKVLHSLKKFFSPPKERKRLNDQEFLEVDIRNELLTMIEFSIEDNLDLEMLNDMRRNGMDAHCTIIEIRLHPSQDKSYSLEFLYS